MADEGFYDKPPMTLSGRGVDPTQQTANMVQYIAHQLFHIRKALERVADSIEGEGQS
jgi:hypothetical protein